MITSGVVRGEVLQNRSAETWLDFSTGNLSDNAFSLSFPSRTSSKQISRERNGERRGVYVRGGRCLCIRGRTNECLFRGSGDNLC